MRGFECKPRALPRLFLYLSLHLDQFFLYVFIHPHPSFFFLCLSKQMVLLYIDLVFFRIFDVLVHRCFIYRLVTTLFGFMFFLWWSEFEPWTSHILYIINTNWVKLTRTILCFIMSFVCFKLIYQLQLITDSINNLGIKLQISIFRPL